MITNEPLEPHFMKLKCGHSFNYTPLYKDAIQLKRMSHMGLQALKFYEIQCPYCRIRRDTILPFISELKLSKKHGINWIDVKKLDPIKGVPVSCLSYLPDGQCEWVEGDNVCRAKHVINNAKTNVKYCLRHHDDHTACLRREERKKKRMSKMNVHVQKNIKMAPVAGTPASLPNIIPKCIAVLKSGKRVGEQCGNIAKIGGMFCLRHAHQ